MSQSADRWKLLLWLFALLNLANGAWMLADPAGWYHRLPAGVPDTGPLNEHFVRDIGSVFVMMGVALYWAGLRTAYRVPLVGMVVLFLALHALVHVYDTMSGKLPAHHWGMDFPAVYLPTVVLAVVWMIFTRQAERSS